MDLVLQECDRHLLTPYVYPKTWSEDDPLRQIISLAVLTTVGGYLLYFGLATFNFYFIFDRRLLKHPHILENQVRREIMLTVKSLPMMSVPTAGIFFLEVRGYGKLYDNVGETRLGLSGVFLSMITFILFTDMCIYWTHRFLHNKHVYKHVHKTHHMWKIPTPFASHAFHPLDGFLQGLPYHIYPFLFPLHKITYLGLFVFVNMWSISIHDNDFRVPDFAKPIINGSAHHADHHHFFDYNYGQFFTLWDRLCGSFRNPRAFEGEDLLGPVFAKSENKENGCNHGTDELWKTNGKLPNGRQENGDVKKQK